MNETLNAAGNISAELGAVKRENERLRGLLRKSLEYFTEPGMPEDLLEEYRAALSQQAEPAPAQDEREALQSIIRAQREALDVCAAQIEALQARPAQTERQPVDRDAITEEVKHAWQERKTITEAVDAICALSGTPSPATAPSHE